MYPRLGTSGIVVLLMYNEGLSSKVEIVMSFCNENQMNCRKSFLHLKHNWFLVLEKDEIFSNNITVYCWWMKDPHLECVGYAGEKVKKNSESRRWCRCKNVLHLKVVLLIAML